MESSSFNEGSNLELFLELNHLNTLSLNDFVNWQLMKVWSMESSSPQNQSLSCLFPKRNNAFLVKHLKLTQAPQVTQAPQAHQAPQVR